jgi:hypothetical protein
MDCPRLERHLIPRGAVPLGENGSIARRATVSPVSRPALTGPGLFGAPRTLLCENRPLGTSTGAGLGQNPKPEDRDSQRSTRRSHMTSDGRTRHHAWRRFVPFLALTVLLVSALPATANATWQPLGSLSAGTGPVEYPQVAVDPNGNAVFTWERLDATTDCSGGPCLRIQTRSRSAAGSLSPIQTLSASGRYAYLPQVAVDANGNAVFVWQRSDGTNMRIQTRVRSAAGTLSSTQTLSAPGQDADSDYPQVAVDPSGNAVFTWERFDGAHERIQARARSAAGTRSSTQTLSAAGQDAVYPQVGVDPNGNAVFAWEVFDGANERIQTRARSAAGTRSSIQTLSAAGQNASSAQVAVDPNGNAAFAWIGSDGTVARIQARTRSAGGTLSSTQTLSDPGKNADQPRVAVDAGGNAVFLWQRFDGIENRVQTRARSAAGTLSSTQTLSGTGTSITLRADVAVDPNGTAVFVWEHRDGTPLCCTRIEALVRLGDGTLGSTQVLSAGQDAQEPQVAVDPNGNAFSVWQERTNGHIHAAVGP